MKQNWEKRFNKKFGDNLEINEGMSGLAVEEYHSPAGKKVLAFIKQEMKRVVKGISAGAILEAQGRKECGDSPYTNGINRGIDEAIDVFKLRITYTDNFLKGIDKVLKAYKYIEKQKIETDRLKAQQRREAGIK